MTMKLTRILSVGFATIIIIATLVTINQVNTNNQQLRLKQIQLRDVQAELDQLETENTQLQQDKTKTEAQKKKAEAEYKKRIKALEAQLEARRLLKIQEQKAYAASLEKARIERVRASQLASGCTPLRTQLANLGVSGANLDAAITLAMRESSCNHYAVNASSGACGAFQSLPCGKWGAMGTTEYLRGAIAYANSRYGSYVNALSHSYNHGWY